MKEVMTKIQELQPSLPSYLDIPPLKSAGGAAAKSTGNTGASPGVTVKDPTLTPDQHLSIKKPANPTSISDAMAGASMTEDATLPPDQPSSTPTIMTTAPRRAHSYHFTVPTLKNGIKKCTLTRSNTDCKKHTLFLAFRII